VPEVATIPAADAEFLGADAELEVDADAVPEVVATSTVVAEADPTVDFATVIAAVLN